MRSEVLNFFLLAVIIWFLKRVAHTSQFNCMNSKKVRSILNGVKELSVFNDVLSEHLIWVLFGCLTIS